MCFLDTLYVTNGDEPSFQSQERSYSITIARLNLQAFECEGRVGVGILILNWAYIKVTHSKLLAEKESLEFVGGYDRTRMGAGFKPRRYGASYK